jgi:leader peptidase (prepilin peptidase) / N-methyltransferase
VNLIAVVVWALVSGVAAALLNPFMRSQFETESWLAKSWLQVPIAVGLGGLAGLAPSVPEQLAFAAMAVGASLLVVIDLAEYRLPDVIVLPLYPVLAGMLTIVAATEHKWLILGRAGAAALAMFVLYFVMAIFARDLGFGDVKLAGVVGGFLGWFGVSQVVAGFLLAWVLMAAVGIVLILLRRIKVKASLPFGPYLIAGAVAAVFLGPRMFPTLG